MDRIAKNAVDVLIGIDDFENARKMLLYILKERPSLIVKAYEALFTDAALDNVFLSRDAEVTEEEREEKREERRIQAFIEYAKPFSVICAIKRYRFLYNVGLKEAKDAVDQIRAQYNVQFSSRTSDHRYHDVSQFDKTICQLIWFDKEDEAVTYIMRGAGSSYEDAATQVRRIKKAYVLEH